MKRLHIAMGMAVLLTAMILPTTVEAQAPASSSAPPADRQEARIPSQPSSLFTREQLAQMLAPIALYPDALLSQVLMAATYPLEVVEADRWVLRHRGLKGDGLDSALTGQEWDPSVKSLCHFPSVLAQMDKNLSRTTQLGNAFLAQQAEVMDVIQELRSKARELGRLESTPQQRVVVQDQAILIEPVQPAVVYVPYYDPLVVFGPWWYPAYPPWVWFPGDYPAAGIGFSAGFFVGPAVVGWTVWDWPGHALAINRAVAASFIGAAARATAAGSAGFQHWAHDPAHRLGAAYADPATARRFGAAGAGAPAAGAAEIRREARGYVGGQPGAAASPLGVTTRQEGATVRSGAAGTGTGRREGVGIQPGAGRAGQQLSPFTGLSRHGGGFESRAAQRGGGYPGVAPFGHGTFGGAPMGHGGFGAPPGHGGGAVPFGGGGGIGGGRHR